MADNDSAVTRNANGLLDLKTVLGGLGACLVLLAGLTWGLINSAHDDEVARNAAVNTEQWKRLRELNDIVVTNSARLQFLERTLEQKTNDTESRIRTLEREHRGKNH